MSWFLAVVRFPYEVSLWDFMLFCRNMIFLMRFHAFWPHEIWWFPYGISCFFGRYEVSVWDLCFLALMKCHDIFIYEISCFWVVMRFPYEFVCVLLHAFPMRFPHEISCFFEPLWDVLVRLYAFCCTIFVRDILMRVHAFLGRYELCVWDFVLFCLAVVRRLDEMSWFSAAEFSCWWCDVRTVESWMLKDAEDWVYTMVYWTLRGFVCASWVVRLVGKECKLGGGQVQVRVRWEAEGFVWKLFDSCHQHALHQKSIRMFEDVVTWPEHAFVMQGGSLGGLKLVGWCVSIWRMSAFFGLFEYFDQGSSASFSCTLTVNVIGFLFLRQCFYRLPPLTATSISGTSRKWPIWITVSQYVYWRMNWRDVNSCYCDRRVQSRVWVWVWWWWFDVKMIERWFWRIVGNWVYSHWSIVTTYVVCDKRWYSYEMSLWYVMLFVRCEISLWDFMPFCPCPSHFVSK